MNLLACLLLISSDYCGEFGRDVRLSVDAFSLAHISLWYILMRFRLVFLFVCSSVYLLVSVCPVLSLTPASGMIKCTFNLAYSIHAHTNLEED